MKTRFLASVSLAVALVIAALCAPTTVASPIFWTYSTKTTPLRDLTVPPKNTPDSLELENRGPVTFSMDLPAGQVTVSCNEVELGAAMDTNNGAEETMLSITSGVFENDECVGSDGRRVPSRFHTVPPWLGVGAVGTTFKVTKLTVAGDSAPFPATIHYMTMEQDFGDKHCIWNFELTGGQIENATEGFVDEGPPNLSLKFLPVEVPVKNATGSKGCPKAGTFSGEFTLESTSTASNAAFVGTANGTTPPVQHVVVILQENHSFDNVLGELCIQDHRDCAAAETGKNENGETIPLSRSPDRVPNVGHNQQLQLKAMDGGKMDGWERVSGCAEDQCYTQYDPSQIPSLAALARSGAISDAFFSRDIVPSWGGHVDFFAQTLDGFIGNNPVHNPSAPSAGPGWGCDSNLDTVWMDPVSHKKTFEPSCIPDQSGNGPYRSSPVPYVPTIADRLEEAGKSWGIYGATSHEASPYKWAICPTFAECLYGPQHTHLYEASQFVRDAEHGTLPNLAISTPSGGVEGQTSQHNGTSMIVGDNTIGAEVSAVEQGPDASSTTIFIYYDDCGCFYDHVTPPSGLGIRLPVVIVSPYAKPGFTDHTVATNSSILAYAEHVLGVSPVNEEDAKAYDFSNSFDYSAKTAASFVFHPSPVRRSSRNLHPPPDDT
jgi:phospholipase C